MVDKEKAAAAKAEGNKHFAAKEFQEAIKHFTEAIGHDPTDHVFFSNRSACYTSLQEYQKGLDDAKKCVELKPDWAKGYSRKGAAEIGLRDYDAAEKSYEAGLKLAPQDAALLDGQKQVKAAKAAGPGSGGIPVNMDDPVKSALVQAAQSNPQINQYLKDEKFANLFMAILQAPAGQTQQLLLQAMQQDQRFGEVLMATMGGMGGAGGAAPPPAPKPKAPEKEVEVSAPCRSTKKEEEKPDERTESQKKADEFKTKANDLYKKRSFEEALGQYDKAIEVEPNDAVYYCNKAAVYMEMGEFDKCMSTCQDVLTKRYEMNGGLPGGASFEKIAKVYNRMAACQQRQKKFDEAIDFYNKALTEDNNKQTRNALRECERQKEKHAADAYLDPAKGEEHKEKGNELFKAQKYPEAKKEYEEAIRRNPKDAKIYSNLAGCLLKLGAAPDALRHLDKCLELDPTFVRAYARKGQAHSQMKEYHKALKAYEDGLKLDKENQELLQGKQAVMYQVQQSQGAGGDQEQLRHAMADPEIQEILKDPQMNIVLQNMQDNPSSLNEYMQDKKIADGINKLIAAGVLKVGNSPGGM